MSSLFFVLFLFVFCLFLLFIYLYIYIFVYRSALLSQHKSSFCTIKCLILTNVLQHVPKKKLAHNPINFRNYSLQMNVIIYFCNLAASSFYIITFYILLIKNYEKLSKQVRLSTKSVDRISKSLIKISEHKMTPN